MSFTSIFPACYRDDGRTFTSRCSTRWRRRWPAKTPAGIQIAVPGRPVSRSSPTTAATRTVCRTFAGAAESNVFGDGWDAESRPCQVNRRADDHLAHRRRRREIDEHAATRRSATARRPAGRSTTQRAPARSAPTALSVSLVAGHNTESHIGGTTGFGEQQPGKPRGLGTPGEVADLVQRLRNRHHIDVHGGTVRRCGFKMLIWRYRARSTQGASQDEDQEIAGAVAATAIMFSIGAPAPASAADNMKLFGTQETLIDYGLGTEIGYTVTGLMPSADVIRPRSAAGRTKPR